MEQSNFFYVSSYFLWYIMHIFAQQYAVCYKMSLITYLSWRCSNPELQYTTYPFQDWKTILGKGCKAFWISRIN